MISTKGVVTGVLNNRQGVSGIVSTGCTYLTPVETDPTVPDHVKAITEEDISKWNSNSGGGSGGTSDYNDLYNKPVINNVELSGELSLEDLGIQPVGEYVKPDDIPTNISELTNDSGYLTEIPTEYITETELNDKGYLTEVPSEYATEIFVKNEIAAAQLGGSDVDLSGYATKDDLNTKVDKVDGKSLIDDTEIERLANISNYDDTEIRDLINAKANPSDIPTNISELTNDSGYLTEIPTEYITETELNDKGYLTEVPSEYITETELNDKGYLTEVPSEYITETELNDKGYLTEVPSEYITETELNSKSYLTEIPEEYVTESELNNKGYLTNHQDISHLASKDYVVEAIGNVKTTDFRTVDELPTENISTNTIYLLSKVGSENNIYEEYIYVNNSWEKIGETEVDLSQYYTKEEIDEKSYLTEIPEEYITETELNNKGYLTSFEETDPVFKASPSANITNDDIANWNNKSEFDGNYSSLNGTPDLFSGSYNDLTDKPSIPTIPTNVSAFTNDAGYLTSFEETDPTVPDHVKGITEAEISKWNSMRTIYTSTSSPSVDDGIDGDIWIIYEG